MYHGFDWYGRTLEVREVSLFLSNLKQVLISDLFRIVMLASPDLEGSVEDSVVLPEGLVVVVSVEEDYEVVSVVVFHRRVVAEISLIKSFTPTILVLINRLLQVVG